MRRLPVPACEPGSFTDRAEVPKVVRDATPATGWLGDLPIQIRRGEFTVTTDRRLLDTTAALSLLHSTFWGGAMTADVLERAIAKSVSFGILHGDVLVGFGRVITDLATYAYWSDVVIAAEHRGQGLGLWLSECMLAHPELQGLRRVTLLTRDAGPLYSRVGFTEGAGPLIYMEVRP
jgi:GNAT superfamily N-acetyltransferase